jgi:hypothetical protein
MYLPGVVLLFPRRKGGFHERGNANEGRGCELLE